MVAPRFFVDLPLAAGARLELPAAVAHHAVRVLRLRTGDDIVLFNGQGGEYAAHLLASDRGGHAHADVLAFAPIERESAAAVTLIQSLAAGDKIDWVIEKGVEVGLARVIVAPAARSSVRLEPSRLEKRLRHWRELAVAACCQSGRNRLMLVDAAHSLDEALRQTAGAQRKFVLVPASSHGLQAPQQPGASAAFAVGPEGGFDEGEIAQAARHDFEPLRLGPRVLRTETAGLVAAAAWLALNGEFDR